jgi:alkylation response protein AidB-like acyl-CoA dehydrogenase
MSSLTPEMLCARARALAPKIAALAEQTERDRRVSAQTITWLQEADLFRILLPVRLGGLELPPSIFAQVAIELSKACGASGWVFAVTALQQFLVSTFSIEAQHDVFGERPQPVIAAAFAPAGTLTRCPGGYQVTARWTYVSGCDVADWLFASVILPTADDSKSTRAFLLIPRSGFRIIDTWHAAAMCGTGSNDVAVEAVFVPDHRIKSIDSMSSGESSDHASMYRLPFQSIATSSLIAPVIGMLEGALESFVATAKERSSRISTIGARSALADLMVVQCRVGEAYALLDASKRIVLGNLDEMVGLAERGESISMESRIRWRRDYALAADFCVRAINGLFTCLGASGILLDNRLQRAWRDINGASRHVGLNWDNYSSMYGQLMLGSAPAGQY